MKFLAKLVGGVFMLVVGLAILGAIVGPKDGPTKPTEAVVPKPAPISEEERAAKIAALEEEVRPIPASQYERNLSIYRQLLQLDPKNQKYRDKVAHYAGRQREAQGMKTNPSRYVKIVDFSWHTDGFGSVMVATFTIKNSLPVSVKDIEVECTHSASSGTVIDSNQRTIFEIIKSGQTRTFRDFNMGFIHSQAKRSGCIIVGVETIR